MKQFNCISPSCSFPAVRGTKYCDVHNGVAVRWFTAVRPDGTQVNIRTTNQDEANRLATLPQLQAKPDGGHGASGEQIRDFAAARQAAVSAPDLGASKSKKDWRGEPKVELNALISAWLDKRGCSRLIATGYALQAVLEEYNAISERTGYEGRGLVLRMDD